MKKRFLSILLVLVLLLGNLQMFSFIASSADEEGVSQIVTEGYWTPEEYETEGTLSDGVIAVKKSISETGKENYFDIDLDVVINPVTWSQSIDVVVVMDISNSMNDSNRIKNARTAVKKFVTEFAADENLSDDREFSLVTFNSNVQNTIPFTSLNTAEEAAAINKIIDGITAPSGNTRFTNIEGGLQMAYNIMKDSDSVYKYIILATDGFPTTYINRTVSDLESTTSLTGWYPIMSSSKYDKSRINEDGYFCNSVSKEPVHAGIVYSDIGAQRAQAVAADIKADGINIFSIGINIGDYAKLSSYTANRLDTRTSNYTVGNEKNSYKNWLGTAVAGGPNMTGTTYVDGDNANGLTSAFTTILKQMEDVTVEFKTETAYTTDPMSQYVEFMNFYDADGASQVIIENAEGEDIAVFDNAENSIKWMLENAEPAGTDENGYLIYNLKYRVRLKTEDKDFDFSKEVPTNETTTLKIKAESSNGDTEDFDINYSIPEVKGFLADVVFVKQDEETKSVLAGAEFTLSHSSSCGVCEGDVVINDKKVIGDSEGKVIFADCLSGHEYTIKETKAPAGYALPDVTYDVSIDYGVVTIDGVVSDESEPVAITNRRIEPVEFEIGANVQLIGREMKTSEFTLNLESASSDLTFSESYANDQDGNVQYTTIKFDKEGTYNLKGYQVIGDDPTVIYDTREYDVQIKVTLNEEGTAFVVETTINGEDVENDTNPEPLEYLNKVRGNATATFTATKLLDGEVTDKEFTFELVDVSGEVIETVKNVNDTITFSELTYSNIGTYNYTIREVAGNQYIVYDKNVYDVEVTVTKAENEFVAEVKYSLDGEKVEVVEFNNTTIKPVDVTIKSHTDIEGRDLVPDMFEMIFNNVTKSNDEDGMAEYQTIRFDREGTFTFEGEQIEGDDPTIIYDKTKYTVVVNVTLNEEGTAFVVETTINGEDVENDTNPEPLEYLNKVRGNATVAFTATKFLDGEVTDKEFTFELLNDAGEVLQTKTNVGENITFDQITYSNIGTYNYTIREVAGNQYIVYDKNVYDVEVTVTKAENEFVADVKYSLDGEEVEVVEFNNTTIKPVEVIIKSHTDIIGRDLTADMFDMTFNGETKANDEDGMAEYQTIRFDREGTFTFEGEQIEGDDPTIIYDKTKYTVVVNVTLNEEGTAFVVETTINGDDVENDTNPEPLEYLNKVRGNATATFTATKLLDGEVTDKEFTFELLNEAGEVIETVKNVNDTITFSSISYDNVGTYNYTIREVAGNEYIVYDKNVYDVEVTVTKAESEFVAEVKYSLDGEEVDAVEFNNTTIKPVDVTIKSHTDIEGRELVPDMFEMIFNNVTKSNDEDGMAEYQTIRFDREGTFTFEGEQIEGDDPTIIYDKTKYTVVVNVTLNEEGTAFVVETTINGEEVENDTNPEPLEYLNKVRGNATVAFTATKLLDGEVTDKEFTFELLNEAGEVIETVKNVNDAITFSSISYDNVGTYNYTIREVAGNQYIVYDNNVYDVEVTVTKAESEFVADVKYSLDGEEVDAVEFNNTTIKPVEVTIKSHTDIIGRDLIVDMFDMTFNGETKSNDEDGMAEYQTIRFDREGTFTFEGEQIEGDDPTIIYDKTKYTVVVNVTLNEEGTAFVVETTINGEEVENDTNPEPLEYLNKVRGNATATFTATKLLDGEVTDKEFTFELVDANGEVIETVKNVNEVITFSELTYSNIGTYNYTIREVAGNDYIVYDKNVYDVEVTVTKAESEFVADVKYSLDGEEVEVAEFNNTTIKPVDVTIKSHTDIEGRELVPDMFEMTFNNVTKFNDEDGMAEYQTIRFDREGTFTFEGEQIVGDDPTIIYDKTKYTVVVNVTLNEEGTAFVVETTINGEDVENDTNPEPLEYLNKVRGNATVVFTATKLLDGEVTDKEFTFELLNEAGEVIETVKNVNDAITFSELTYNNIGTYNYTIREVAGNEYIVYDKNVYDVEVTVTKAENEFVADVKYSLDGEEVDAVEFNNTTIQPVDVTIKSHTDIEGRDLVPDMFEMTFNGETKANDEDGMAEYQTIRFDREGTFTFEGEQIEGDDPTIIYDKTKYTVVVNVTLNEEGTAFVVETTINGEDVENDTNPEPLEYLNKVRGNATATFTATKLLDNKAPLNGMFTFVIKDQTGKVVKTATNAGAEVVFENMMFDEVGTYEFTISELAGKDANIIYDKAVYNVIVTVTADENTGDLVANVEYVLDGKTVDSVKFNNKTVSVEPPSKDNTSPVTGESSYLIALLFALLLVCAGGAFAFNKISKKVK